MRQRRSKTGTAYDIRTMEKLLKDTLKGGKFEDVSPTHSKRMSAVKWRGNRTTERRLRSALARAGIRGWKLHPRGLPGNPDFFFPAQKVAIFVDGCFWHGCPKCGHIPSKNNAYWSTKILRNQQRDAEKARLLRASHVRVLRFWEHEIQGDLGRCVKAIDKATNSQG